MYFCLSLDFTSSAEFDYLLPALADHEPKNFLSYEVLYSYSLSLFSIQHCSSNDGTTRPLILVTASVDKMLLKKPIRIDTDLTIEGAVTWVGRSSMEIQLEVMQSSPGIFQKS